MAKKEAYQKDEDLIIIGRAHGSENVALEASEAVARWKRDLSTLSPYGHGQTTLDLFERDRAEHEKLRTTRPEALAAKRKTVRDRDAAVAAGWAWVDKVTAVLTVAARADAALAGRLREAAPRDDATLDAGIGALALVLEGIKAGLPAEVEAEKRLSEAPDLRTWIKTVPGQVGTSKAAPVQDTRAIDLLDGKLYVAIRDLYKTARKAIRNGALKASLSEYRFHRLNRSGRAGGPAGEETSPSQVPVKPA